MNAELVILTKSSKHKGYCVAGIDMKSGQWIRLTSDDESTHGALFPSDMRYESGGACQPLDVVKVKIISRSPLEYQPENVLIAKGHTWEKMGTLSINEVLRIHPSERHNYIFGNQGPYVTASEIGDIGYSLTLVTVKSLHISKTTNLSGAPRTKTSFLYDTRWYNNMSVTDPAYYSAPDGTRIKEAALVISLPDAPFNEDKYYKFVAQIYQLA